MERLRVRWNVENPAQVFWILLTFSVTGSVVVYLKQFLYFYLGYTDNTHWAIKTITYLLFVFPAYQILILVFGAAFGQFHFFWEKEKRLFQFIKHKLLKL
jgi:ABC-type multidrug transport system permease subunit